MERCNQTQFTLACDVMKNLKQNNLVMSDSCMEHSRSSKIAPRMFTWKEEVNHLESFILVIYFHRLTCSVAHMGWDSFFKSRSEFWKGRAVYRGQLWLSTKVYGI